MNKPLYGPVLLCLLGTANLAIAFETAFWLDLIASVLMLAAGVLWRVLGTKYVLSVTLDEGKRAICFFPNGAAGAGAVDAVHGLIR